MQLTALSYSILPVCIQTSINIGTSSKHLEPGPLPALMNWEGQGLNAGTKAGPLCKRSKYTSFQGGAKIHMLSNMGLQLLRPI